MGVLAVVMAVIGTGGATSTVVHGSAASVATGAGTGGIALAALGLLGSFLGVERLKQVAAVAPVLVQQAQPVVTDLKAVLTDAQPLIDHSALLEAFEKRAVAFENSVRAKVNADVEAVKGNVLESVTQMLAQVGVSSTTAKQVLRDALAAMEENEAVVTPAPVAEAPVAPSVPATGAALPDGSVIQTASGPVVLGPGGTVTPVDQTAAPQTLNTGVPAGAPAPTVDPAAAPAAGT